MNLHENPDGVLPKTPKVVDFTSFSSERDVQEVQIAQDLTLLLDEFPNKPQSLFDDTSESVTGFNESVTGFNESVTGFNESVTGFNESVAGFNESVTGFNESVTGFNESVTDLDEPVTDLDEPVTDLDEPVTDLDEPVTDLDESVTDLDESVTDLDEPVTDLNEPVTDLNEPVTDLNEPVTDLDESVTDLNELVTGLSKPVIDLTTPVPNVLIEETNKSMKDKEGKKSLITRDNPTSTVRVLASTLERFKQFFVKSDFSTLGDASAFVFENFEKVFRVDEVEAQLSRKNNDLSDLQEVVKILNSNLYAAEERIKTLQSDENQKLTTLQEQYNELKYKHEAFKQSVEDSKNIIEANSEITWQEERKALLGQFKEQLRECQVHTTAQNKHLYETAINTSILQLYAFTKKVQTKGTGLFGFLRSETLTKQSFVKAFFDLLSHNLNENQ